MFTRFKASLKSIIAKLASSWRISPWFFPDDASSVQASLIRLLAVAHSKKLDLPPLVECFALEHRGLTRVRLWQLARRLKTGTPMLEAIEQTPGVLNDEAILSIRFGMQSGTLDAVLSALVERSVLRQRNPNFQIKRTLTYHTCFAFVASFILTAVVAFIFPTFSKLFSEMEIPVTQAQISLEWWMNSIGTYIPFFFLLVIAFGLVIRFLNPIRSVHRAFASRFFRSIAQLRVVHLLRLLSIANDAGRPLAGSMSTLAKYHFDRNVRAKLLYARNEIELAAEPWSSLASAKLLNEKEAVALAGSHSTQTRSWLLQKLADTKEERVIQRLLLGSSLIHPVLVIVFGLLVLWFAWACFGTLCQLIQSLA